MMKIQSTLSVVASSAILAIALVGCSSAPSKSGGAGGSGSSAGSGVASGTGGTPGTGGTSGTGGAAGSGGTGGATGGTGGAGVGAGGAAGRDGSMTGTDVRDGDPGIDAGADTGVAAGACGTCPSGVAGHCEPNANYPTYNGFTLALAEDFCTAIDLDRDPVWTWSDGAPADGDTWFDKTQISFVNGKMRLTAIRQDIPAGYVSYSESDFNSATGRPTARRFLSGEFRSRYNNYRYGRYEVNFKSPIANPDPAMGGYLATMFTFRTPKWIAWNEVDLELEPFDSNVGSIIRRVAGNVVNFVNNGAGVPGYPGGAAFVADPLSPTYIQTESHTYAFEWTATGVTWFLDGRVIHSYAGGPDNGGNTPRIPNLSAKIMMNLWVFLGTHFGDPAPNVYPLVSEYEYFRFYKATGETYPCSPTPGCLSAADTMFARNNRTEATYPLVP